MVRLARVVSLLGTVLCLEGVARGQDAPRNLPTGGRSVLMGNTGIALGRDGSAPFLNPATIGAIEDTKLAFSANLYRLSLNNVSSFFQPIDQPAAPFDGVQLERSDFLDDELDILPSTLCFFFTLGSTPRMEAGVPLAGRQKLAVCFGQTFIDDFSTTATTANGRSPTLTTAETISVSQRLRKASIGPTYGVAITDHLSFGASVHATLTTRRVQWRATSLSADSTGHAISTALLDDAVGTSLEVTSLAGLTYRASPFTLGLAASLPAAHVFGVAKNSSASQVTGTQADLVSSLQARGSFSASPPIRFDLGAGVTRSDTNVELDVGISLPTGNAFDAAVTGSRTSVVGGTAKSLPYTSDVVLPATAALTVALGLDHRFASGYSVLGGASADLGLRGDVVPAQPGFHDYAGHQNRVGVSLGGGRAGDGGELLVGTELSYGFGPRYAPAIYSLQPGFAVVRSDSLSILLVVAGSASVQTLKKALDDVTDYVTGTPSASSR